MGDSSKSELNDSFDDILANIEDTTPQPQPSESKKPKLSEDASASVPKVNLKESSTSSVLPSNISKSNCVLVNPRQRGNPILKSVTNVQWEFDDSIIPDYVVGATAGILYLSLRYHQLNPDYIHNRLKDLGKRYELRVLLVQVDTKVKYECEKE